MLRAALLAVLAVAFSADLRAETSVTLHGQVSAVDALLAPYFGIGDEVRLSFSYQAQPGPSGSGIVVGYPLQGLALSVGNDSFTPSSAVLLYVENDVPFDELGIFYPTLSGLLLPPLATPVLYLDLAAQSSLFADASLHATLPPLESFFSRIGFVGYDDLSANSSYRVTFAWDNLSSSVAAIPEAHTYALLLAGLALLGFARRRQILCSRIAMR